MLENLSGENTAITTEEQKTAANDENNYYPTSTLYQCSFSERWENY